MDSQVDTAGDNQNDHVIISNYHIVRPIFPAITSFAYVIMFFPPSSYQHGGLMTVVPISSIIGLTVVWIANATGIGYRHDGTSRFKQYICDVVFLILIGVSSQSSPEEQKSHRALAPLVPY